MKRSMTLTVLMLAAFLLACMPTTPFAQGKVTPAVKAVKTATTTTQSAPARPNCEDVLVQITSDLLKMKSADLLYKGDLLRLARFIGSGVSKDQIDATANRAIANSKSYLLAKDAYQRDVKRFKGLQCRLE